MESFQPAETAKHYGGRLGKIDAPLNKKLKSVEWGEFKIGDLFEVCTSKSLDEGKMNLSRLRFMGYIEFVGRTDANNGVKGYIKEQVFLPNNENVISVSQIGTIVAQIRTNKWYASQNMFVLKPKDERIISMFTVSAINKTLSIFSEGYSYYPTLNSLRSLKIQLPTRDGTIDYSFMGNFIAELEAERIAELEAYLSVTGLKNYELTDEEQKALREYKNIKWGKFRIGTLFEKIKTRKLPYKADNLPKQITDKYNLPCLTSSFRNQGLNYFVPRDGSTIIKNVVSIPSNSDVYRAYYQSNEFTILSDAYAIQWIYGNIQLLPCQYLYVVSCINKVTDLSIYSYKNKLGGWKVVQNKCIYLPIKNEEPNYDFMKALISAIQKLVIKDVVLYADRKINATKAAVKK